MTYYRLEREQYARIYGCTARSVSNYQRDDAPLDDPATCYHWFYSRRSQPAGITNRTEAQVIADYETIATAGSDWEQAKAIQEMSDHLHEIDMARWYMRDWLKTNGHLLRADAPARLEQLSVNILAELAKIEDLPGPYDDEIEDEEEEADAEQPAENVVLMPAQTPASDRAAHA